MCRDPLGVRSAERLDGASDAGEGAGDAGAEGGDGHDADDGDQSEDQTVLGQALSLFGLVDHVLEGDEQLGHVRNSFWQQVPDDWPCK